MKFYLSLTVLLFLSFLVKAQQVQIIQGIVVDKTTKEPIRYANVFLAGKYVGTTSNSDGEFVFKSKEIESSDTIQVSYLGYKKWIKDVKSALKTDYLEIELEPQHYMVNEISVKAKAIKSKSKIYRISDNAKVKVSSIVQKAVENIPKNYPNGTFQLKGYYRDYIEYKKKFINLYEAALLIEDNGFSTNDYKHTKLRNLQNRFKEGYAIDKEKMREYDEGRNKYIPSAKISTFDGNEFCILRIHDPIRNHAVESFSYVYVMDEDFVNSHSFKKKEITFMNDRPVYVFDIVAEMMDGSATGQIYIDAEDYGILKFTYEVFSHEVTVGKIFGIDLEYKKIDDTYYLNYLSFNNLFENKNYLTNKTTANYQFREFFVTEVILEPNEYLNSRDLFNKRKPLYDIAAERDDKFWDDFNFILRTPLREKENLSFE